VPRTVLINAGPWLRVPPGGYGGIEAVLATLVPELRRRGVRVWMCGVAGSTLPVDRFFPALAAPMFEHIAGPYNRMMGIAHAHMQRVLAVLREHGASIDLVHDHLEVVGAGVLAAAGAAVPPVLQTLHWDLGKHPDFYGGFDGGGRVFFNAVSAAQLRGAPASLRRQALGAVPLGTRVRDAPFRAAKGDAFLVLARVSALKGQDLAVRVCRSRGWRCELAGPVAGMPDAARLEAALAVADGTLAGDADVRYFRERVEPQLGDGVRWIGTVSGAAKLELLGRARALLCPITWDEPGATTVVEALACGTPVIGMRRGALPDLVDHGVTGFLARDEEEFAACCARAGEIDPRACRAAAEARFDAGAMAEAYIALYEQVVERARR
jgi:glycosyltransferase involved in cell wall biosynthesis